MTALAWPTAWRIARRDLSARFKGLRLLLVCLFLGVGALAAIGTLTGAIESELKSRGKSILGGDIQRLALAPSLIAVTDVRGGRVVLLDRASLAQKAEVTVHVKGRDIFVEQAHEDLYAAIDQLMDKLDRQVCRHKDKLQDHHHQAAKRMDMPAA